MRHIAKLLENSRGITLVELLAALTISTLVLGIAYGLLMMGYKTYEKVGIEQSLRDEADYVVSRIMAKFYEGDISDIKNKCQGATSTFPETDKNICIEIQKTVTSKIAKSENSKVGITSFNELKNSLYVTQIKIIKDTVDGKEINNVVIEDYEAERSGDGEKIILKTPPLSTEKLHSDHYDFFIAPKGTNENGSEINATCSYESTIITDPTESDPTKRKYIDKKCINGIVDISLIIKRANIVDDSYKLQLKSQFGF